MVFLNNLVDTLDPVPLDPKDLVETMATMLLEDKDNQVRLLRGPGLLRLQGHPMDRILLLVPLLLWDPKPASMHRRRRLLQPSTCLESSSRLCRRKDRP